MDKTCCKFCLICLKSEKETYLTESLSFLHFFIHVIGVREQDLNVNVWLCIWCKASLKRTSKLIKLAQQSQKMLTSFSEANNRKTKKLHKELYNLSYHSNSNIDILPEFEENNEPTRNYEETEDFFEIEETYTNADQRNESEGNPIEETVLNNSSNENDLNISDETAKRRKKDINFEEMMFEVKFLDTEEQMKEIELKKNSEKYKSMNYHCENCGLGYLTDDVFTEHNDAGPHKCDVCHLRFKSKLVHSQHILAHRRRFICLICQGVFKRWAHCIAHRYKCGSVQSPVVCGDCRKIFSDPHSLDVHIKGVHRKEMKHVCEQCDKLFASKQRLRVHLRTHTANKQFACPACSRAFCTRSNLRAHASLHAPRALHYCVECDTHYKSEKGLRRHLAESAKHLVGENLVYKCLECSKRFATEKALNTHMNIRHLTTYRCSFCNKTFSNNANLRKHIRCIHSTKTEGESRENHSISS